MYLGLLNPGSLSAVSLTPGHQFLHLKNGIDDSGASEGSCEELIYVKRSKQFLAHQQQQRPFLKCVN